MAILQRPWSLNARQRTLVVLGAVVYLFVFHPWGQPNPSIAANTYAGATAILSLAILPRSSRLIHAACVGLGVAFVVFLVAYAILAAQA